MKKLKTISIIQTFNNHPAMQRWSLPYCSLEQASNLKEKTIGDRGGNI